MEVSMEKHIKFPSIEQFKTVIKKVSHQARYAGKAEDGSIIYDNTKRLPVLAFEGTVKLHGTNAAIVSFEDGETQYQSRERVLSVGSDNSAFMFNMLQRKEAIQTLIDFIKKETGSNNIAIYGEWCGEGIQSGVGISKLPKMFVIFGVRKQVHDEDERQWVNVNFTDLKSLNDVNIYHVNQFPTFNISIDFETPALSQNKLIEFVETVEAECPVAKHFGVSGTGEGIVWKCVEEGYRGSDFWFKTKGEKHSVSKVKTLVPVDDEKVKSIREFVDNVVTEARLEQGISYLKEMNKELDQTSTGDFLRWIVNDILKEEIDTMTASGIEPKYVNGQISKKARTWYFQKVMV